MIRKLFAIAWFVFFGWLISTGCAAQKPESVPVSSVPVDEFTHAQPVAACLVFEPSESIESAALDLSRESRQPAAFVGFEEQTQTFYYMQVDNHQGRIGGSSRDGFDRHDYIGRFGVSYR